jgi:quercetin dioxygenase-like cupin family protein
VPRELVAERPVAFTSRPVELQTHRTVSVRPTVTLMALGLVVSLAAAGIAMGGSSGTETKVRSIPLAVPAPEPERDLFTLRGPEDVAVVTVVYEAGQSSGWHAHAGIHAIAVVAGEVTIYERDCVPQRVAPGRPYVGGQELHLVRNETADPVHMIVTYLNPATPSADAGQSSPPPSCTVS